MGIISRVQKAWNAFSGDQFETEPAFRYGTEIGDGYGGRPDRVRVHAFNERSIVTSIYNRLAMDVADINIRHVRVDEDDRFAEEMKSKLNDCLRFEANIDQPARSFRQDIAMTLFTSGVAAIVPTDTSDNPAMTPSYDIYSMRVGTVVTWYPKHVRVSVYNESVGRREEIVLPKAQVAIVENPLYSVMNEPNSTLQRLIRKLSLLDSVDEQSASGKLDLIIQLPYTIKTEARREQADQRRRDIELQLKGSQYGIAYTDGTEKITQLNRPVENNLMKQVEYLTLMLYGQLGITDTILNGTADEKTMLNYTNRTVSPILTAITEAMTTTFLTKTARTQGQRIRYFTDPFKLVPLNSIAEIADKFTRNEILTSNEIRSIIGIKPASDPKADELRNSNMPQQDTEPPEAYADPYPEEYDQNGA